MKRIDIKGKQIVENVDRMDINLLVLAVVLATLAKPVVILKLGLRNISKRITSLIFLNIYTSPQHVLTRVVLFVIQLKN